MDRSQPVTICGTSHYLVVPIVAIPAITAWAFGYYGSHLPEFCLRNAEKVIGGAAALTVALALAAAFLRSRRIVLAGTTLSYHSWFTDRTIAARSVRSVSYDTEVSGTSDSFDIEHYITLQDATGPLLKMNSRYWPASGIRAVLHWLRDANPGVPFDTAVERYLSART